VGDDGNGTRNTCVTLTNEEQALIRRVATPFEACKCQLIFREGEYAQHVYFIEGGHVKVYRNSQFGKITTVGIRVPGDLIGVWEVLSGMPRRGFAEAIDRCTLWRTDAQQFLNILHQNSAVAVKVATALGNRLREVENAVANLVSMEVDHRLAKVLISLAQQGGKPGTNGILIAAPLTHQDLADMIGSCRQTVTTVMRRFKEAGYIVSEKRVLEVVDLDGLQKFCSP